MTFDEHGHILISPREVQRLAFDAPDHLIDYGLIPGTPKAFARYEQYARFLDYMSSRTGIHPHHFVFRGSTKIGYSIAPNRKKFWRQFGQGSDLDLAIIDPHFYSTLDEEVRRYDRLPKNRNQVFRFQRGVELDRYHNRIDQKGRHDCYRFFDLPRGLACIMELESVLKEAPIADCCVHGFIEFNAFIFRDRWAIHRRYHTDIDDLRRGLRASDDPLPQAPDQPLPSEGIG
jgi:hypothetical protein